jgi:hypothetical protein
MMSGAEDGTVRYFPTVATNLPITLLIYDVSSKVLACRCPQHQYILTSIRRLLFSGSSELGRSLNICRDKVKCQACFAFWMACYSAAYQAASRVGDIVLEEVLFVMPAQ